MEQEQTSAPVSVFCVRFANSLYYMRQRYYNTEIKRFINQDIVVGSISNSQSLNRYSYVQGNPVTLTDPFGLSPSAKDIIMGAIHGILDVVGCSPELIGMGANLINAALYAFVDHDYGMAALSLLAGVTFGAAKVVAMGGKFAKAAKTVETAGRFISNVASFAICTTQAVNVGSEMWQKYYVEGKSLDGSSAMEFLTLGLNMAGMAMSGKGMVESGNKICKSIKESGVTNKVSGKVKYWAKRAWNSNGGFVDPSAPIGGSGSKADLGSKLDYQFGKAGGNKHNIDRTNGLKAEMDKLGFDDTVENRTYFEQYYNDVLNDSSNIVGIPETASYTENGVTHYYTVTTRESFLMGKYGGAKVTTHWEGNRLLTIKIGSGKQTRYNH
ncbi:MAG: hypothetical protein K2M78_00205 [Lachnospiraceae bacterium]|nr:hypothetical protein [Lachnospiraceae bacterium]